MRHVAFLHQPAHRLVAGARLRLADDVADREEAPPRLQPRLLRGEEVAELDRLVPRPEAAGRAEIRDAAFGRDARTGKDHRPA